MKYEKDKLMQKQLDYKSFVGKNKAVAFGLAALAGLFVAAVSANAQDIALTKPESAAKLQKVSSSVDPFVVQLNKQTRLGLYIRAKGAYQELQKGKEILFIDVRTRAEINFLGLADGVHANIPVQPLDPRYIVGKKGSYKRMDNPDFSDAVGRLVKKKGLSKNPTIFIICRSGRGSAKAVNLLAGRGYTKAWTIIDGFQGDKGVTGKRDLNGWVYEGLPWHYGIKQEQAYKMPLTRVRTTQKKKEKKTWLIRF